MSKTFEMELYTGPEIQEEIRKKYNSNYALFHKEEETNLILVEDIKDKLFDNEAFYIEEYKRGSWAVYEHSTHCQAEIVVSSTSILGQFRKMKSSIGSIEDRLDNIERVLGEVSGVSLKE